MNLNGTSMRVTITATDDDLVEFTCDCGGEYENIPCVHGASFFYFLADYFESAHDDLYAHPGQPVAQKPYRLTRDNSEVHPTVEAITALTPQELRKFVHTLQILNGENVGHLESALAIVKDEPEWVKGRAHDLVSRAYREYVVDQDDVAMIGLFTDLMVKLDQLLTLSEGIDLFDPYKRFWTLLTDHRKDFADELSEHAQQALDNLIKTVHTHVLTALAHTPVDSRELVEWLLFEQQRWPDTLMRLRDIGHRLSDDDLQFYFEHVGDRPEWLADVELFTGDPRTVIDNCLQQENIADAVGALMAIRSREQVLEEAHRILEFLHTVPNLGRHVEPAVDLIGFINGLEEGENLDKHVETLLDFNSFHPDPGWIVAAMEMKQDMQFLFEWYQRFHTVPLSMRTASTQVREGLARASWAIALERPEMMEWIVSEGILFTPKGRSIMDALGEIDPDLFVYVYKRWFEREHIFLEGDAYVEAAAALVERVAEYNLFAIAETIELVQVIATHKTDAENVVENLRMRIEEILM